MRNRNTMQSRVIINKEYIPALLNISSHIEQHKDLWYNGYIIGLVRGSDEMVIRLNSFAQMHCSIRESDATFIVDGEIELHNKLQEFDFSTLNKGIR